VIGACAAPGPDTGPGGSPTTPPPTSPTPVDTAPPVFAGVTSAVNNSDGTVTLSYAAATDDVSPPSLIRYLAFLATNLAFQAGQTVGATSLVTLPLPAGRHAFVVRAQDQAGLMETNTAQTAVIISFPSVSFSTQVQPIFSASNCTVCHPPTQTLNLRLGTAYGMLVNKAAVEDPALMRVQPGDAIDSYLWQKIAPGGSMAGNLGNPIAGNRALIQEWILEGAPNN